MKKLSLTEATMKALEDKLIEKKDKKFEDYTARQVFDARMEKYTEEDKKNIKVLVETEHYLLAAKNFFKKPDMVYLDVMTGKTDDHMLPSVYIDQDSRGKCKKAMITWGAHRDCTIEETLSFIKYLSEASDFVAQIDGKDFSNEI